MTVHPPLTALLGVQIIQALYAQAAATRTAIQGAWFFSRSSKDAELGDVRIVEDTAIAALRDTLDDTLNGVRTEAGWYDLAETAENTLKALKHYQGEDNSIAGAIAYVAAEDARAVGQAAEAGAALAAKAANKVLGGALSFTWTALPTPAKVGIVVAGVAAGVYFVSKALTIGRAVKAAA
jgi:hypothetical protein